jgi:hypothetical protein
MGNPALASFIRSTMEEMARTIEGDPVESGGEDE